MEIFGEVDFDLLWIVKFVVLMYYEKWNGKGYLNGLKGEEIFIEGRIVVIVDVFDVLISKCFYKEVWSVEKIMDLMKCEVGEYFEFKLVELLEVNLGVIFEIKECWKED